MAEFLWTFAVQEVLKKIVKFGAQQIGLWVKELQDIAYEADDLLNELVYEDLRRTAEQTEVRDFISISPSKNPFLFRCEKAKKMKNTTQTLYKHYCEASALELVGDQSATETEVAPKQIRETTSNLDFEVV
ncbi:putative disease resistance protein RGA3 [Cucumis melo var. makuwa]|uniref:Disease resistance protein RGA3 n=1 Tax=Cucumis melo var. makuwa TaxID=1194695 RepID=A0A5A7UFH2_CUCMM|nr:putative disease resistance protein RGA3 [Cucumis melo var. makuwa]TYK25554.1 putative disease resistance protein RGA3 [Cucumis melo var. makuwa]